MLIYSWGNHSDYEYQLGQCQSMYNQLSKASHCHYLKIMTTLLLRPLIFGLAFNSSSIIQFVNVTTSLLRLFFFGLNGCLIIMVLLYNQLFLINASFAIFNFTNIIHDFDLNNM